MYGTVVGVLRGGPSRAHEASLLSGHAVVANLPRSRFTVRDIYIDKQGMWHERGKPAAPADILRTVDVVFSTLHGEYGESGEIQRLLELSGVPYIGANPMNSYISMHKVLSKEKAKEMNIKTPQYRFVQSSMSVDEITYEIVRNFQQPIVVKPVTARSSMDTQIVGGYAPIHRALSSLLAESGEALIEEMIRGIVASVDVVEGLRGESLYAFPPVEIVMREFDLPSVRSVPGTFPKAVQDELVHSAQVMHEALGQRHYSRSNFIVAKKGIYFLNLHSAPSVELSKESALPKSLASVGIPFPDFLSHVVELALV